MRYVQVILIFNFITLITNNIVLAEFRAQNLNEPNGNEKNKFINLLGSLRFRSQDSLISFDVSHDGKFVSAASTNKQVHTKR